MVTEYEARKLIHEMRDELHVTPNVALRYIPGALLFFGFALAGLLTDQQPDAARDAAAAGVSAAVLHHGPASIAETRRVLEERRKRFEARAPAQAVQRANAAEINGAIEVDAFAFKARASD